MVLWPLRSRNGSGYTAIVSFEVIVKTHYIFVMGPTAYLGFGTCSLSQWFSFDYLAMALLVSSHWILISLIGLSKLAMLYHGADN